MFLALVDPIQGEIEETVPALEHFHFAAPETTRRNKKEIEAMTQTVLRRAFSGKP
jgi:hypothetical protein